MIEERRLYRLVGFDPGAETFGCSVIDLDLGTGEREVLTAHTLKRADLLTSVDKDRISLNGVGTVGWMRMLEAIKIFIGKFQPNAIVYENAHYKRGRITAYRSLTTAAALIKQASWEYGPDIPIYDYQPNEGKVAVGVKPGSKDKELLLKGLRGMDELGWADSKLLEQLDEHSRDAVAIGLAHLDKQFGKA